jgi:hypothetical protein
MGEPPLFLVGRAALQHKVCQQQMADGHHDELALEKLPSMLLKRWGLLLGGLLNGSELIAQPLSLALESSGLSLLTLCVPLLPNGPVVFHSPVTSACAFTPGVEGGWACLD